MTLVSFITDTTVRENRTMNPYDTISEHLQGASAALEMAMQEIEELEGLESTYLAIMYGQLAKYQRHIDNYMKDLAPLQTESA